jgi:hypothetical protein
MEGAAPLPLVIGGGLVTGAAQCEVFLRAWEEGRLEALERSVSAVYCVSAGLVAACFMKVLMNPQVDAAFVAGLHGDLADAARRCADPRKILFDAGRLKELHQLPVVIARIRLAGVGDGLDRGCPVYCFYYEGGVRRRERVRSVEDFVRLWPRTSAIPMDPIFDPWFLDGVDISIEDVCEAGADAPPAVLRLEVIPWHQWCINICRGEACAPLRIERVEARELRADLPLRAAFRAAHAMKRVLAAMPWS